MTTPALIAVVVFGAFSPEIATAQQPCPEREAVQVVHALLDRGAVVRVPLNSRARLPVATMGDRYPMPGGPSAVVLVRLPDASGPYTLTVRSRSFGALLYTDAFELTRVLPVFDFVAEGLMLRRADRAEAVIPIEPTRGERYVLLYGVGLPGAVELQATSPAKKQ
jgi:hypothetical protein